MSAKAYFEVLRIEGEDINASLRLLRLLAQHSGGLRHVLEDGFRNSAVSAWLEIVPQLFSRLHHPEPYVRNAITQLLERIASERPDDVVFAVVVASNKTDSRIEASLRDLNTTEELLESEQNQDDQLQSLNKIRSKAGFHIPTLSLRVYEPYDWLKLPSGEHKFENFLS